MNKLLLRGMDYQEMQMLTVQIEIGQPHQGFVKVFDCLDQEILVEKVQILLDNSGQYELSFVHNGRERSATLINIEACNNTMTSAD